MEVRLRPWREEDAASLRRYADDAAVAKDLRDAFPLPYAMEDAECFIRVCMAQEEIQLCRAVEIGGEAAGSIGVFPGNDVYRRSGELGYWLARRYWGQGIMTDAVGRICREAFERHDLVRIWAGAYARNLASRRVLEKNGFTLEGIRRGAVWKDGQVLDDTVYALLRESTERVGPERVGPEREGPGRDGPGQEDGARTVPAGRTLPEGTALRPWREEDAPSLARYADDPAVSANLTDAFPRPYGLPDATAYIRSCGAQERTRLCRAIEVDGEAAGNIDVTLRGDVQKKNAVLGYWLGRPFWGRGIMTAAVERICREAFERFDIVRIEADIFARNAGSRRVVEKNGFTLEGIRRAGTCKDGQILDDCIYALLREDRRGP